MLALKFHIRVVPMSTQETTNLERKKINVILRVSVIFINKCSFAAVQIDGNSFFLRFDCESLNDLMKLALDINHFHKWVLHQMIKVFKSTQLNKLSLLVVKL